MRSIRRADQFDGVVTRLAEDRHPVTDQPIFQYYRDLALFAALLGLETGTIVAVGADSKDLVEGRVFMRDDTSVDLLYAVAIASTKDVDCLRPEHEDKLVELFESYVNGGLRVLSDWLRESPEDPHGDKALLNALFKYKFLNGEDGENTKGALEDVTF